MAVIFMIGVNDHFVVNEISNNVISSNRNRNISYHKRFGQKLILLKPFCL